MEKIRILDLFSGTGSVKKAAALDSDFECFSLDISDKFSTPDIKADVHEWNYKQFGRGGFDIIAASVPCQMYSCARTRAATPRDIPAANKNIERVLEIVDYFNQAVFWIENPVTIFLNIMSSTAHMIIQTCLWLQLHISEWQMILDNAVCFVP
jgi:site-specific DNA-cytosine methylase